MLFVDPLGAVGWDNTHVIILGNIVLLENQVIVIIISYSLTDDVLLVHTVWPEILAGILFW